MKESFKCSANVEMTAIEGLYAFTILCGDYKEHHITVFPVEGEDHQKVFKRAENMVSKFRAQVVSMELFGMERVGLHKAFKRFDWPVTQVNNASEGYFPGYGGVQIMAISVLDVSPLRFRGRILGVTWSDSLAQYCRLGDLYPENAPDPEPEQTLNLLETMVGALETAGLSFLDVRRTWFYFEDILAWYSEFNKARDQFFTTNEVFKHTPPASTGMGGPSPRQGALCAGLYAMNPFKPEMTIKNLPSPLQCPALDYGSSFSRAMEIKTPNFQKVMVSGTASINEKGKAIHEGDIIKQINHTMNVVEGILESRSLDFTNTTRAIAYLKRREDLPVFKEYLKDNNLTYFPVIYAFNNVCWDELLFEIELDAVK